MDDVNYLRQHAKEESFLFVVDSARRDTSVFALPNEYEVQFNSPFRNVVGLDLLDATVPRTEYLVERGTNALVFTHQGTKRTAVVDPGDYTLSQLVAKLNAAMAPHLAVQATTAPVEVSNKVRFVSAAPFTVHARESSMQRALGLGTADLQVTLATPLLMGTQAVVTGPLPALHTIPLILPIRQPFVPEYSGTLTAVRLWVKSTSAQQPIRVAVVGPGNALVAQASVTATVAEFEQVEVTLGPNHVQAGAQHYLVLQGGAAAAFGGPGPGIQVGQGTGAGQAGQWWNMATWTSYSGSGGNSIGSGVFCLDIDMAPDGYAVEPPGVVDLTGEPYVLVRCPEVEQQLYRDRAYETVHAGMGMVKLGNYGFREQRYDFVSFPPRRLPTPIGKLGKLSFRLEKGDGSLYDTKGVNHTLVLVIRYLEMTAGPDNGPSVLNPRYTPNPLTYLQQQNPHAAALTMFPRRA